MVYEIMMNAPENRKEEVSSALKYLSFHNICIDKVLITKTQIQELLNFNTSIIPTAWSEGNLDTIVIIL